MSASNEEYPPAIEMKGFWFVSSFHGVVATHWIEVVKSQAGILMISGHWVSQRNRTQLQVV